MQNISVVPSIADLWRDLRAWLADALRACRGPAMVAKRVTRKAQDAVAARLRLIESLLLKLLLIEAASLHPFPRRGEAASPGAMNTGRAESAVSTGPGLGAARQSGNGWVEDPAKPETWRVRFRPRLREIGQRICRSKRRVSPAPARAANAADRARRLARRLEALRRVIANPRRAIAALARKLQALGAAAHTIARVIALSRPRTEAPAALAHAMICAHDAFHDSS